MVASWPQGDFRWRDEAAEEKIALLQEIIREIRYLRAELQIPPSKECVVWLSCDGEDRAFWILAEKRYIEGLSRCRVANVAVHLPKPERVALGRVQGVDVYLLVEGMVDVAREVQRLEKKLRTLGEDVERLRKRLENPDFLARAPEEVVAEERKRYEDAVQEFDRLKRLLEGIR